MNKPAKIPSDLLIDYGLDAMYVAMKGAAVLIEKERGSFLSEISTKKIDNITRKVDEAAEYATKTRLYERLNHTPYKKALRVWGEESITSDPNLDLSKEEHTIALLDMIDGTDLLNRQISEWCSAMVFYYPPEDQILASLVGLPSGRVYFATHDGPAYVSKLPCRAATDRTQLHAPQESARLNRCGVCFYGQKARNFLSLFGSMYPDREEYVDLGKYRLGEFLTEIFADKPPFRIYNLGGNPMMVKVAEGTMQAVFELLGQKPHDVVPGAFIAKRAGAVVKDLNGNDLDLAKALRKPNEGDLTYIIAANTGVYRQLRDKIVKTDLRIEGKHNKRNRRGHEGKRH